MLNRILNRISAYYRWSTPTTLYVPRWFPEWLSNRFFDAWEAE